MGNPTSGDSLNRVQTNNEGRHTMTDPTHVVIVHGFNVRDAGGQTIDHLGDYFTDAGCVVHQFDYGFVFLLGVRFGAGLVAKQLAASSPENSIAVGHSHGCSLIDRAAWLGAPFLRCVYINPALDQAAPLARQVDRCDVWHSPSDLAVRAARFLPWHPWGAMGAWGAQGTSADRYDNHDKEFGFPSHSSHRHSDVFSRDLLPFFGPLIVATALTPP